MPPNASQLKFFNLPMDVLEKPRHLYIVGIKGVGMTALAQLLAARGHRVEGSDVAETFFTDHVLREHKIPVHEGFTSANIPADTEAVIYSTAYTLDHVELAAAAARGLPLFTYPEILGELFRVHDSISVAGTHGKTTTTALLGAMLAADRRDPTVIVGSDIPLFHGNARIGTGPLLVVETDEYQNKFTHYAAKHLLLTNVEYDHPDFFKTEAEYYGAFAAFIQKLPMDGIFVSNADDRRSVELVRSSGRTPITFGTHDATVRLLQHSWAGDREQFTVRQNGIATGFFVRMPGKHNAMNATAAITFARAMDVADKSIHDALDAFTGVRRRFELLGTVNGTVFIDDYAHHPTEIAAAIAGARECFSGRRLITIFRPHTYSRTKALLNDFAASLTGDENIVVEVYGSARETVQDVSSHDLISAMPRGSRAQFAATVENAVEILRPMIRPNDVVLLLGAGDTWKIAGMLGVEK